MQKFCSLLVGVIQSLTLISPAIAIKTVHLSNLKNIFVYLTNLKNSPQLRPCIANVME